MSRQYAEGTAVTQEKSRAEIEQTLIRFGADAFNSGYEPGRAHITFRAHGRWVRLVLTLPDPADQQFQRSPHRNIQRSASAAREAWEQECRRRWRSLALLVKAKLAAIADGIATFEEEFLPHIIMPDDRTVAEHVIPKVAIAYQSGDMPPLLPGPTQ